MADLTPNQIKARALALARQREREMVHPPRRQSQDARVRADLADQLGIPFTEGLPKFDSLGAWQRLRSGTLGSDTPPEGAAFMEQLYPGAETAGSEGYVAALPPGADRPVYMNPPGFQWGDIPQVVGQEALPTVGSIVGGQAGAALGSAGGVPGRVAGAIMGEGLGASGGEMLKEGIQAAAGTQRETPEEFALRAANAGLIGAAGRGVGEVAAGTGRALKLQQRMRSVVVNSLDAGEPADLAAAIEQLAQWSVDPVQMPSLKIMQKSENPVIKKLGEQAMQFSAKARQDMFKQAADLARVVQEGIPNGGNMIPADRYMAAAEARRASGTAPPLPNEVAGGLAGQQAVDTAIGARRTRMKRSFGELDNVLVRHDPSFGLQPARQTIDDNRVLATITRPDGEIDGRDIVQYVDVSDPGEQLRRINHVIQTIDSPVDYGVMKNLRSRVGKLLEVDPTALEKSNASLGQAKGVYRALSRSMEQPRGVSTEAADEIVAAHRKAMADANPYYESFTTGPTRQVINTRAAQAPSKTWDAISTRKSLDPAFIKLLNEGDPAAVNELRTQVQRGIMAAGDPVAAVRDLGRNPEARRFLFPDDRSLAIAEQQARVFKEYKSSPAAAAEEAAMVKVGAARDLLNKRMAGFDPLDPEINSPVDLARRVVDSYGGGGSDAHKYLRQTVLTDIIDPALKTHAESGLPVLDPVKLGNAIQAAQKKGVYDGILNDRDRKLLETAVQFARKTQHKNSTATGLAIASQIGQLRQADPVAAASIWTSSRLAGMMTAENLSDVMLFKPVSLAVKGARGAGLLGNATFTTVLRGTAQHYLKPMLAEYEREQANRENGQQ